MWWWINWNVACCKANILLLWSSLQTWNPWFEVKRICSTGLSFWAHNTQQAQTLSILQPIIMPTTHNIETTGIDWIYCRYLHDPLLYCTLKSFTAALFQCHACARCSTNISNANTSHVVPGLYSCQLRSQSWLCENTDLLILWLDCAHRQTCGGDLEWHNKGSTGAWAFEQEEGILQTNVLREGRLQPYAKEKALERCGCDRWCRAWRFQWFWLIRCCDHSIGAEFVFHKLLIWPNHWGKKNAVQCAAASYAWTWEILAMCAHSKWWQWMMFNFFNLWS